MSEIWGIPSPYKSGGPKTTFGRQSVKCVDNYGGLQHLPKIS